MAGVHDPRHEVQRRPVPVAVARLRLTRVQADPHRQADALLRFERRLHRIGGRVKDRAHAVAGVLEHLSAMRRDRRTQHLVVLGERRRHARAIDVPPLRGRLDVREQERDRLRSAAHRASLAHFRGEARPESGSRRHLRSTRADGAARGRYYSWY